MPSICRRPAMKLLTTGGQRLMGGMSRALPHSVNDIQSAHLRQFTRQSAVLYHGQEGFARWGGVRTEEKGVRCIAVRQLHRTVESEGITLHARGAIGVGTESIHGRSLSPHV